MSEADHACYVGRNDAEAISVYWLDNELKAVETRTFPDTVEAEITQFLDEQAWQSLSAFGELYLDP